MVTQINGDLDLLEPEQAKKLSDHWLIKASLEENKPKYEKKRINLCKTKQLEHDDTVTPLLENLVKKGKESASEDLVNTYNKGLQELYNHVAPIKPRKYCYDQCRNG